MRPKSSKNAWMPDCVKLDGNYYVYYKQSKGIYQRLSPKTAEKWEVLKAHKDYINNAKSKFPALLERFLKSDIFLERSPRTQENYLRCAKTLSTVFENFTPDQIEPKHIRIWMDAESHRKNTANYALALLSITFTWAIERGFVERTDNPCAVVKKYKQGKGGRYVSDDDYNSFYNYLLGKGHKGHAAAMEIAYLTGSRQQDVLRLLRRKPQNAKESDCYLTDKGIYIYQQKTGRNQIITWSDRLRKAIKIQSDIGMWVISRHDGARYTASGFKSTWQRVQVKAFEEGIISERFRFHDLKIKAVSDYKGDKKKFSGHATQAMADRYNRLPDVSEPLN